MDMVGNYMHINININDLIMSLKFMQLHFNSSIMIPIIHYSILGNYHDDSIA